MFLWKNMDNYPKIIPVTPSYLEHCHIISKSVRAQMKEHRYPHGILVKNA